MSSLDTNNGPILKAFLEIRSALAASVVRVLVNPNDVEDILQETYLLVCCQAEKSEIKSVKGYFFRVARNMALKDKADKTKAKLRSLDDIALFEPASDEAAADEKLHYSMKLKTFMEVAQSLPKKARQAFLLKKVVGLSQREIAKKMGIAESTVEKHLIAAMHRTVSEMKSRGYEVMSNRNLVELPMKQEQTDRKQASAAQRF